MTKISQLSSIGDSLAIGDQFLIRDIDDAGSPNKSVTVSGITRALADGDATAPALAFAADKNTGIYRAGTDSLAVATNGVGRLFVDANGNTTIRSDSTSITTPITLQNRGIDGAGDGVGISFNMAYLDGTVRNSGAIYSIAENNHSTVGTSVTSLVFSPSAANVNTERLRITSAGLVGIGTSAPQAKFEVAGDAVIGTDNAGLVEFTSLGVPFFAVAADASNYRSTRINIVSAGGWADLSFDAIGTAPKTGLPSAGSFSGSIMYLDASAQRVGIGSTSPDALLTVNGIGAFGAGAVTTPSIAQTGDLNTGFWFPAADTIAASTAGSERARIDSSGRLLVGTTTTSVTQGILCQATASADGAILLARNSAPSATQTLGYLAFSDNGHVTTARIAALRDSGTWTAGSSQPSALVFSTTADGAATPTERLRITSAGLVGIGTTPVVDLDVAPAASTATFRIHARSNTTPVAAIELMRGANTTWGNDGYGDYRIKNDGGNLIFEYGDTTIGNLERARIDSSGRLLIGTSSAFNSGSTIEAAGSSGGVVTLTNTNTDITGANSVFGQINFYTADTSGGNTGIFAKITAESNGNFDGNGSRGMDLKFFTGNVTIGANTPTERLRITSAGVLQVAEAGNIAVGTTTGTKIGTATTQKLGFYNATPVVQPAAVADATDAASGLARLNDLLARLRTLGIIAT